MATILSGLLFEEVAKELLEDAPLPEILPVILYDEDELLLLELLLQLLQLELLLLLLELLLLDLFPPRAGGG